MDRLDFQLKISQFRKKLFPGEFFKFGVQRYSLVKNQLIYNAINGRAMTDDDLWVHFQQKAIPTRYFIQGSYQIAGRFEGDILKFVVIDADSQKEYEDVLGKVVPIYDKMGIDYILEWSQENRLHLWCFLDSIPLDLANAFWKQILEDAESDIQEVFPTDIGAISRANSMIRLMGGYHYKTDCANPITYHNKTSAEPEFIIDSVISCTPITREFLLQNLRFVPKVKEPKQQIDREEIFYFPQYLAHPTPNLPGEVGKLVEECQAINWMIKAVVEDKLRYIDNAGGLYHMTGLWLASLAKLHDVRNHTDTGLKWFKTMLKYFRSRSAESHNWLYYYEKKEHAIVPKCETLEKTYGQCEGCPLRGRRDFWNPRQIIERGVPIIPEKIEEVIVEDDDDPLMLG